LPRGLSYASGVVHLRRIADRFLEMLRVLICFGVFLCSIPLSIAGAPKAIFRSSLITIEDIKPNNLTFEVAEDGTRYVALRLRNKDAEAVRAHIRNMHLSTGQSLFLYSPDGRIVYGPFEGAGPLQSGEFWSLPVPGDEIVIEFQTGPEPVADLPFHVDALEPAIYSSSEPGAENIDKPTLYEGDILLEAGAESKGKSAVAITEQRYRWPNGTMPYLIASNVPNQSRITDAVAHWNQTMAGTVRMIPRTTESKFVVFSYSAAPDVCNSYVGMTAVSVQSIGVGDYCATGNIIHEIGHAWGLWHEHTREDRDRFVKVNWDNITAGQSSNFTQNITNGDDIGSYDYNSIMHYNEYAFSSNGLPTIETIPAGIPIGQRSSLSTGDIAAIKSLYPNTSIPTSASPVSVTVTSNPLGSTILIDGTSYVTPSTFAWTVGSTHMLRAIDSDIDSVRKTFVSWSDSGAQDHSITVSPSLTMLKADYAVSYSVKASGNSAGTIYVTPGSEDGYYAAGSALTLTANPMPEYCFSGWTGLIAGSADRVNLAATRPYDLQANFQPGDISLSRVILNAPPTGSVSTIDVDASSACTWAAYSAASWVTVLSPRTGSGSGTLTVSVAANPTRIVRFAQVMVGHKSFIVVQAGSR
jgi:hypothetical protein